jgi:hypothetical protein
MSAMSANFAVAPAHVRSTAAIRRAGRASAKRVIARGVKAEAVKEAVALNTTKSDAVRTPPRATDAPRASARSTARRRARVARQRPKPTVGTFHVSAFCRSVSATDINNPRGDRA